MRYRPTESYAEYAKGLIGEKTLIVDLCGTGNSLKYFCDRFGGSPLLVVGSGDAVPYLVRGSIRETSNPAPHPTIGSWPPGIGPVDAKVSAMIDAFVVCADIAAREGLTDLDHTLEWALGRMEDPRTQSLWAEHLADCKRTYDQLNSGPLPHSVIL